MESGKAIHNLHRKSDRDPKENVEAYNESNENSRRQSINIRADQTEERICEVKTSHLKLCDQKTK